MQYVKLLTAVCKEGVIHFDDDGRIWEYNRILDRYVDTEKFVHLDYHRIPMYMLAPEYVKAGGYDPIYDELTPPEDVVLNKADE